MKSKAMKKTWVLGVALSAALALQPAWADNGRGMNHSGMNQMNGQGHGQMMREAMGMGQVNKVMPQARMISITHEPIRELQWPKMRMNFKTADSVDLSALKPGQKIHFMLQVDENDNYLIKSIEVVE